MTNDKWQMANGVWHLCFIAGLWKKGAVPTHCSASRHSAKETPPSALSATLKTIHFTLGISIKDTL